jgi:hypothetical protein
MKSVKKHGQEYFKDEPPAMRRFWKRQRRKAQRANDRRAIKEAAAQ